MHFFLYFHSQIMAMAVERVFRYIKAEHHEMAQNIIAYFSDFFDQENFNDFLQKNGGWVGILLLVYLVHVV